MARKKDIPIEELRVGAAQELIKYRTIAQLTMRELARLIHVSPQLVSRVERQDPTLTPTAITTALTQLRSQPEPVKTTGKQTLPLEVIDANNLPYKITNPSLITRHRRQLKLTQRQLAEKLGVKSSAIVRLERGEAIRSLEVANLVARELDQETGKLFVRVVHRHAWTLLRLQRWRATHAVRVKSRVPRVAARGEQLQALARWLSTVEERARKVTNWAAAVRTEFDRFVVAMTLPELKRLERRLQRVVIMLTMPPVTDVVRFGPTKTQRPSSIPLNAWKRAGNRGRSNESIRRRLQELVKE